VNEIIPVDRTPADAPRAGRREWIALAVLALPCLLYSMDLTVLHLAIPALTRELAPSATQLLWIIDIYGFLVAGSLITMGTLGDRIGRRRLLFIGAAAFGLASVLAAFSTSADMLIATRALLGIAGATLAPSTMSLVRNLFRDPKQFMAAIGVIVSSYSAGAAIGPLVGGALLEHFWWGSAFLVAVPVMVLLLAVGPSLLPEYRDPNAGRLDLVSAALSLAAVLAAIYGLKQIAQHGLETGSAAAIVAGLVLGAVFVQRQRRLAEPLIDLRLFANKTFTASLAAITFTVFVASATFIFVPQYLQLVRGLSPLDAGLWMLGWPLGFIAGSNLTPIAARRVRPSTLMAGGLALAALGNLALTRIDAGSSLLVLAVQLFLIAVGLSPVFSLANGVVMSSAPPERAGAASGISSTAGELGIALGIALPGSVGTAVYRGQVASALPTGVPAGAADAARETLGGAAAAAGQLPTQLGAALLDAAQAAFVQGLHVSVGIGAVVVAALAVFVALSLREVPASGAPAEESAAPAAAGVAVELAA
jgi:DHA2 family multidrug resistance protein-like MFS transporter